MCESQIVRPALRSLSGKRSTIPQIGAAQTLLRKRAELGVSREFDGCSGGPCLNHRPTAAFEGDFRPTPLSRALSHGGPDFLSIFAGERHVILCGGAALELEMQ